MSEEVVKCSKNGAIATITLNRPEKYNTLRVEVLEQLEASLRDANRDDNIKVIVLEGAGDSFCGGFGSELALCADIVIASDELAKIPLTQLVSMKLIVNQAYDNMGLQSTQILGPILDGAMRNTKEGREFVRLAQEQGVKAAVTERDGPFGDYSQGAPEERPRRRSQLGG